uniref:Uncharacterized protein n=1 Tax=Acrobeloides nanus TaxID=290746 RepID=A0A914E4B4_9BILA
MSARNNNAYMGKKYYITYDDREEPYAGIVKGICETEKQAEALIEKFTNVDEATLRILKQKIPSLQSNGSKNGHLSSKNIKFFEEFEPKPISKAPTKWYKNGELVIQNDNNTTDIERIFEETDIISAKKLDRKLKLMKKKK